MRPFSIILVFLLSISTALIAQDATQLFNEGEALKKEGKIRAAMSKYQIAIEQRPGYTEAIYALGWCQNDTKDYKGAIVSLRKAREKWYDYAKVHFELGWAFQKSGNNDSAIASYNSCLKIKPDYTGVYKQLGYIAYDKDDNEKALAHFEKAIEITPSPIKDHLFWYKKGFSENALKKFAQAKVSLERSLEFKTDYDNTYLELGFAATKLKQNEEAIEYFKKAIEIDPKRHVGYNGIAEVYRDNIKDMDESIAWYKKALDINPNERKANFGMGYCLNSKERCSEAIPYFKTAINNEKDYTAAFVELGYAYYMIGDNDEALKNLKKAMSLSTENVNGRYYAGLVYVVKKDKYNAQRMVDDLKNLGSQLAVQLQGKVNKL